MDPPQEILREILEDRSFSILMGKEKFETFVGQIRLVPIAIEYSGKLCFSYAQEIRLLQEYCRCLKPRKFFKLLMSLVEDLKEVFAIPKQRMSKFTPTPHPNEVVMVFIDFLLQLLEEIMRLEPDFIVPVKGSIQNLQTELGFLISFLGDEPLRTEADVTKNILSDIEVVVNEVGSFLYSLFSTRHGRVLETVRLSLSLSDFLQEFELLKTKIKEHCTTVPKLPGCVATKSSVISFFAVDSLLDDLEDLNYKADRIVPVKNQIIMLYEDISLLRSTLNYIDVARHLQLEELAMKTEELAYEISYVINSVTPVWYLTLRLSQFLEKIYLVKMAVQEKKSSRIDAGIPEEGYPCEQVQPQAKELHNLEDDFVGFKNEKTKIADQLTSGPLKQQIISIVGMPGLGKTSLAKKLFNDPFIVYYFDKCAWCVVSQTYKKKNVLIDIFTSTRNHNRETLMEMEEEDLAEMLYKSLKGMRYLIVMDDVWDTKLWDDLKRYFPDDRTGSRILFTSRNKELGFNDVVHELPFLSDAECWELLRRKVFQTEPCPPELLEIGKKIASSCHGLPLSVIMISSVLANMEKKESSWRTVAGSLSTHIFDDTNNCLHILKLSYQHLSVHLKPCFLYFGVFEEDEVIPVRKLISLWVAEGFINKENCRRSEDVARDYLMDLINRGLVLVAEERSNGGVKACMIHDLLHDLCLRIAKEENFMGGIENGSSKYKKDMSILKMQRPCFPRPFDPYVRSQLGRRVMDLSGRYQYSVQVVSGGIENLVHLRYLAVSQNIEVPLIEKLHRIEYLLLESKATIVEIPEYVLKMKNLKHLHFGCCAYFTKSSHSRATTDRSFQMNNLQSVSTLVINNEMDAKVLGRAPNLRKLKCVLMSQCPIQFPNQIESLNISYGIYSGNNFPLNLKKLTIRSLTFDFPWEKIRMIGRLPNLEVLKLREVYFEEKQWDTEEGEFQKLKFFELNEVESQYEYAEWNPTSDDYPKLERLVLRNCDCLNKIPSSLGYILTLQKIEVHGCAKSIEESALEIRKEQQEMGNEELKVIISRQ